MDFEKRVFDWVDRWNLEAKDTEFTLSDGFLGIICQRSSVANAINKSLRRGDLSPGKPLTCEIWAKGQRGISKYDRVDLTFEGVGSSTNSIMTTTLDDPKSMALDCKFALQNPAYFEQMNGNIYIHRIDRDAGFPIVALKPDITPRRLNQGWNSLGQPLRFLNEKIALPREELVLKAVESGQNQATHYQYVDVILGLTFWFKLTVEFTPDRDELIVNACDDPDHPEKSYWQRGYWLNWVETQKAL